jgi:hypothetical protein
VTKGRVTGAMTGFAIGMSYSNGLSVPSDTSQEIDLMLSRLSIRNPTPLCLTLPLALALAFLADPDYSTGCSIALGKLLE